MWGEREWCQRELEGSTTPGYIHEHAVGDGQFEGGSCLGGAGGRTYVVVAVGRQPVEGRTLGERRTSMLAVSPFLNFLFVGSDHSWHQLETKPIGRHGLLA